MNIWSLEVNFVPQIYTSEARQQLQDAFMAENDGGFTDQKNFYHKNRSPSWAGNRV